jgi:hypothetical protein
MFGQKPLSLVTGPTVYGDTLASGRTGQGNCLIPQAVEMIPKRVFFGRVHLWFVTLDRVLGCAKSVILHSAIVTRSRYNFLSQFTSLESSALNLGNRFKKSLSDRNLAFDNFNIRLCTAVVP